MSCHCCTTSSFVVTHFKICPRKILSINCLEDSQKGKGEKVPKIIYEQIGNINVVSKPKKK
jgi:hypothetical protein